jgi:hypothetical protein
MTMQLLAISFQSAALSDQGSPDGQCQRARNRDAANERVAETSFLQNCIPNWRIHEFFREKNGGRDAWEQEYREEKCTFPTRKKSTETQDEKYGR